MDAAIRYSPHSTPAQQRFLVLKPARHMLKFYQVEGVKGKQVHYTQLSQHTDFSNVRAFDWSPTEEAIVAVGLSSGEAALLRIDDSSNGVLSFNFKNPRPCNAIALSVNGHLAAGLDKVRNDFCLNIWDINYRLSTWDRRARGWASTRPQYEPIRKLASSETISSVKFFSDVPETLVTGVKGQFVRIYDLRGYPGEPSIQYPTRCAHNLSIDAQDENYFASASNTGEPTICVWDRRAGPHSSATVLSSGHTAQATQSGSVLEFRNCLDGVDSHTPPSIWSVRYCRSRRGVFGVLSNLGQLKVYEMAKEYMTTSHSGAISRAAQLDQQYKGPRLLYTKRSRDVQAPYDDHHKSRPENERIESFDFMASGHAQDKYRMIICRCNGSLEAIDLHPQPAMMDESAKGEVVVAAQGTRSERGIEGNHPAHFYITPFEQKDMKIAQTLSTFRARVRSARNKYQEAHLQSGEVSGKVADHVLANRDRRLESPDLTGPPGYLWDFKDVLLLGTVERRRAEEGYLFNCAENVRILSDDPGLQELWGWVEGAENAAKQGGMTHKHLDLAFLGVHGVWNGELGPNVSRRHATEDGRSPTKREIVDAAQAINTRHKRGPFKGIHTAYPALRQLCLGICGWTISMEQFEAELQRIQTKETRTKAAAWAMFHGHPQRAIEVVLKGNDADKLVAMALAAFYNKAGITKEDNTGAWSALCNEISEKAKDPWSKAILALVSTENWKAVIKETSLPLRDRIGVALKYLEDKELTRFLDDLTRDCVEHGDIEGIWLTGITRETADLFQNYIIQHNDIQTAVLVMSYSVPLYFDDYRFRHWRTTYCNKLDMYNLHVERCLYTQQHTKKSLRREGRSLIKSPPRQITVRCNYCDQSVVRKPNTEEVMEASISSTDATAGESSSSGVHTGNPLIFPDADTETVCPNCGRHLPRCGVCMMWLGTADPRVSSKSSNEEEEKEDPVARFLNFCNICHHGFHAHHARDWFAKHRMCPVPECDCLCAAYETS